ncbi:hypothetical protein F5I97DRAFT_1925077 [Phlebopus sp. FC_14]|nr:hypothetical protein F5I97DRAFT_1925077 [Phlebopus sp. FC_14]
MSDRHSSREQARPTLPPVRDLFRDELSRSPRPPLNLPPPWIVPSGHVEDDHHHPPSLAAHHRDGQLYGPGVQHSSSAGYYPLSQRHDPRVSVHSFRQNVHDNPTSTTPYHPQLHPQYHSRPSSDAVHQRPPHDHTSSIEPHTYFNQTPQPYTGSSYRADPTAHARSSSAYYGGSASYPNGRPQPQFTEPVVGTSAPDGHHHSSAPVASTLKYECDYCGKGFTRPSSLKIHLNSHTGEKPFACTFEGCGRSFSVLSNMRRHARVHAEVTGRQNDGSGDEFSDRRSPSEH